MGRLSIHSGRYVPVVVAGKRQWARDQVALQAGIVELLTQQGGMPKKQMITALRAALAAVDTALNTLLDAGTIERYRALSIRCRLDERWCVAGQSPASLSVTTGTRYNALATLTAMQQHAALLHTGLQQ